MRIMAFIQHAKEFVLKGPSEKRMLPPLEKFTEIFTV
jgi:hypothetical protein